MAITSLSALTAASKQRVSLNKSASRSVAANNFFSLFDLAGNPPAGTLAGTSTTAGVVPTSATTGYPYIKPFGNGNTGYVGGAIFSSSVLSRIVLYDRLFLAGAYAFNANTALTGQPSFASRLPDTDYSALELWVEWVTTATGTPAVTVTYTNESGVGTRSTGAISAPTTGSVGLCWKLPLQSGDSGIQQIDNVQCATATAGTFNVMILRRLAESRITVASAFDKALIDVGAMNQIYANSALYALVSADGVASGTPDINLQVING